MKDRKIIQIIPAVGWYAKYKDEHSNEGDIRSPLICWALVEDETGTRSVVGMDTVEHTADFCDEAGNFAGYEQ